MTGMERGRLVLPLEREGTNPLRPAPKSTRLFTSDHLPQVALIPQVGVFTGAWSIAAREPVEEHQLVSRFAP